MFICQAKESMLSFYTNYYSGPASCLLQPSTQNTFLIPNEKKIKELHIHNNTTSFCKQNLRVLLKF